MNVKQCDICGRTEYDLGSDTGQKPLLKSDTDGIIFCPECNAHSTTNPVEPEASMLPDELLRLVGKSAGAICYSLNLPYEEPYTVIIDSANEIAYEQNIFMSTWEFCDQHHSGITLWRAPDGRQLAVVTQRDDGSYKIEIKESYS